MSKSKGDFLTVSLLEQKGYNPLVYRMFCLQSHYRKPLEFSFEVLDQVAAAYQKLVKRIAGLKKDGEIDTAKKELYRGKFLEALANDINTSSALTVVYDLLKDEMNGATKLALVEEMDYVLGLNLLAGVGEEKAAVSATGTDDELTAYILAKIEERKEAKKAKDFAKADAIREELLSRGVAIKDTREGVVWELV